MSYVHRKYTLFKVTEMNSLRPADLLYWECFTCSCEKYPFQSCPDSIISTLAFNSNMDCSCRHTTESLNVCDTEIFKISKDLYMALGGAILLVMPIMTYDTCNHDNLYNITLPSIYICVFVYLYVCLRQHSSKSI